MKEFVTSHIVEGVDPKLTIEVKGKTDIGTTNRYDVHGLDTTTNSFGESYPPLEPLSTYVILFQDGPFSDDTVPNGLTIESLLAICKDRLVGFQNGPFDSIHNQVALEAISLALDSLNERTRDRIIRGVKNQTKK